MDKAFYLISGGTLLSSHETLAEAQREMHSVLQSKAQREVYLCEVLPREYLSYQGTGAVRLP